MKILVLAGGADQTALIQELKERGHQTILVDYYDNPPAKLFADKHIVASTLDVNRVREIALYENVNLICTACTDQALLTVAQVSEELGLPCYISYQTALNVTNKSYMKRLMIENGIPTSKYKIVKSVDLSELKELKYPLVVKPVDCNSSKGVLRINSINSLPKALADAISFSRTNTAVVEEFKVGEEISADFYVEGGTAKFLCATSSKKVKNSSSFTITQSFYPVVNSQQVSILVQIAQKIVDVFKISNSPLLIQLIANGDKMSVIEFSARMGGGSKYKLIEVLTGVNIMKKYVDLILGLYPEVSPQKKVNYAACSFVYCKNGEIGEVKGFDSLLSDGTIQHFFLYKTKGMVISQAKTSGDRAAGYIVTAQTESELKKKIEKADSSLSVLDSHNKDIMIHGWI